MMPAGMMPAWHDACLQLQVRITHTHKHASMADAPTYYRHSYSAACDALKNSNQPPLLSKARPTAAPPATSVHTAQTRHTLKIEHQTSQLALEAEASDSNTVWHNLQRNCRLSAAWNAPLPCHCIECPRTHVYTGTHYILMAAATRQCLPAHNTHRTKRRRKN